MRRLSRCRVAESLWVPLEPSLWSSLKVFMPQAAVRNNHNRFIGGADPSYSSLDRYSYHAAGGSGYYYGVRYAIVRPPQAFPNF